MAGDLDLTANLAGLIENANRRFFERNVQPYIMLHVASPSDVRGRPRDLGLISLKRCTAPGNGRGPAAGRIPHLKTRPVWPILRPTPQFATGPQKARRANLAGCLIVRPRARQSSLEEGEIVSAEGGAIDANQDHLVAQT